MKRNAPVFAVIIGSGFAGSILARVLRRLKKSVVVVEKSRHPRFALGESTTPIGNLSLERLAARYRLGDLRHMAAYGRWLDELPHLRRGLKRGFTFFNHRPGE
ncbi:MAG: NAD(P)-binding protein, partial [Acidobacteriota bacterium]